MNLEVFACGWEAGRGSHISFAACLNNGEFDEKFKWLSEASILVKLLSQESDNDHYFKPRSFHLSKMGPRQVLWPQFVPHCELRLKYLKSNCSNLSHHT